jgi:hypothetical protein
MNCGTPRWAQAPIYPSSSKNFDLPLELSDVFPKGLVQVISNNLSEGMLHNGSLEGINEEEQEVDDPMIFFATKTFLKWGTTPVSIKVESRSGNRSEKAYRMKEGML